MKTRLAFLLVALLSRTLFTLAQEPSTPAVVPPPLSGTGTPNHVAKWLTTTTIGNTGIFENSSGNVGVGTVSPATKFDVNGTGDFRNTLTLFPNGTHPTLSVSGTAFQISSTGRVTFVAGQTFPGMGTVSTINSGTGLTGGPIHTTGTLSVNSSVVPLLADSNVFTANQTINGSLLADFVFLNGSNGGGLIGEGGNPTAGQPGNPLTVFGGSPSSPATDLAGGDLILTGGAGFGTGGSGAVRIQTAPAGPSGTGSDNSVDRQVFAPKSVPMGGQNGITIIFVVTVADGDAAGAIVRFTIRANDGGSNFAAETGSCMIAVAVPADGGGAAFSLTFGKDSASLGSVNAFCSYVSAGANQSGIAIADSLAFTPTTHDIYFEIDNVSGSPLSSLPSGSAVHLDPSLRVDALHPSLSMRRSR